jgi:hypothetical protein
MTPVLAAAWIGSGATAPLHWILGAWLLAEGSWQALRWLFLDAPWERLPRRPPESLSISLPYMQPGSPAEGVIREVAWLANGLARHARERPELPAALITALVTGGLGLLFTGWPAGWLTLGTGIALALARRLPRFRGGFEGLVRGTFPWWLGMAGGYPTLPAWLAGVPIGLLAADLGSPLARWGAWALWVAWAVVLGHAPGAYGLALVGLLLEERRGTWSPRVRWLLWLLALALAAWVLRAA